VFNFPYLCIEPVISIGQLNQIHVKLQNYTHAYKPYSVLEKLTHNIQL